MINYMSAWVSIADMKKDYLTFFYMKMSNYMSPTNMRERQNQFFGGLLMVRIHLSVAFDQFDDLQNDK